MTLSPHRAAPERTDAAPAATRSQTTGVAQPAAAPGLVLVAASVVLGARLMAAADDTVAVWALSARPARRRERRSTADLERRRRPVPGRRDGRRATRPPTTGALRATRR